MSSSDATFPSTLLPRQDHGPGMLALQYVLFAFATLAITLRSYIQVQITRTWGWDDNTIWVAWVSCNIRSTEGITTDIFQGLSSHRRYSYEP